MATMCAMSFYPTVDAKGDKAIRELDGWLIDVLTRAYAKRCKLLSSIRISSTPLSRNQIISGSWYKFNGVKNETKLPSYYLSWLCIRKTAEIYGLQKFPSPIYGYFLGCSIFQARRVG